ncbi:MAG: hypothetical protein ACLU8F_06820 [Clostridia bacterium]
MIKKFHDFKKKILEIDKPIVKVMKQGYCVSFSITLFSCILLLVYDFIYEIPMLYDAGTILFKTSLLFFVAFFAFGFFVDTIRKQLA